MTAPFLVPILLSAVVFAQAPAERRESAPRTAIELKLRVQPFQELWYQVRALGSGEQVAEVPEMLRDAAAAARALGESLPSPTSWGPLEGTLASCDSATHALQRIDSVPETVRARPGQEVPLRAPARAILEALAKIETSWRESVWPERERRLREVESGLAAALLAKQADVWAVHAAALGFEGLELTVPSFLVTEMPSPGAITHRGDDERGVCFVSVKDMTGSKLWETVVHEATHALDIARDGDAFDALRAALERGGNSPRDRVFRDAPHALMFVQSAETVRRVLAPDHEDYGVTDGLYDRIGPAAEAVRTAWHDPALASATIPARVARIVKELSAGKR
jgi:hypothetical protein